MADAAKSLSGLLSGIVQNVYYEKEEMTEDLLRTELFPDLSEQDFRLLFDKMSGLLKSIATADMDHAQLEAFLTAQSRKQGSGGVTPEQAAALSRLWRSHRGRVRDSLLARSRWGPGLRGLSWRVDLRAAAGRTDAVHGGPVALVELELGRAGQDSDFLCLEFDEAKVNQVLKKMADIQESVDRIVQHT